MYDNGCGESGLWLNPSDCDSCEMFLQKLEKIDAKKQNKLTPVLPIQIVGDVISHADSGVVPASRGDTSDQTPGFGGSFTVLSAAVDAKGHVTEFEEHLVTVPNTKASSSNDGLMSAADKAKLDTIESGSEPNQNAFSNVKVGSTTVAADTPTDTLELVAGSNVTLTPDASSDKITIAATDSTYPQAVKEITRNGTTFTATRYDGTTFTFTQQDNNTTYSAGTNLSLSGTTFSVKDSPAFTGTPTAPTNGTASTSNTQIATTAFVQNALARRLPKSVNSVTIAGRAIANNTEVDIDIWTAPSTGTVIGEVCFDWGDNGNYKVGMRRAQLMIDASTYVGFCDSREAVSWGHTWNPVTVCARISSGQKLTARVRQTSGGSITMGPSYGKLYFIPD